jgi:hypothetical protein
METRIEDLKSLLAFAAGLDLADPTAAKSALDEAYPLDGEFVQSLRAAMEAGVADGSLCDQGKGPMRWSRIFGDSDESCGLSADAVLMSISGPRHSHPNGEIDLCFAVDGTPEFDGNPPGWTVYAPGSEHVPTVTGGTMLILYLLPQAAIRFLDL